MANKKRYPYVTTRINEATEKKLKEMAKKADRPVSYYIRKAIEKLVWGEKAPKISHIVKK